MKIVRSWSKPPVANIIGRKKVDWSIFVYGSHIPIEFREDFAIANDNYVLKVGERITLQLQYNDKTFTAHLNNINNREKTDDGSLQIRYDSNSELKQFLKEVFSTSYQYLLENRVENSKKPVIVPDEIAEYIDFIQTDQPFVYKMVFHKKPLQIKPNFWWVNQGQTHKQERDGGFLWAPQKNSQGRPLHHHVRLTEPKTGDIVFCYSARELKSVGIVRKPSIKSSKPNSIASHNWEEEGYLLELEYYDFTPPIKKEDIPLEWRKEEGRPFDVNADLKQGYFFDLSEEFANKLYSRFFDRFPTEVKIKMEYQGNQGADLSKENPDTYKLNDSELIHQIYTYIKSKGFYYKKEEVINLYLSIKTKPFVILSGISGTGKTKMVQWFAESVGATEENGQFTLIPIRPDWNDSSDLLGYKDIKGDFIKGPLTKIIERALANPDLPYFVLLDEMNLARVEYYFSDILSVMESRKWNGPEIISSKLLTKETAGVDLRLPNNIYIIGTVNMDETTHPFSKKVLDRANTIEFNRIALDNLAFLQDIDDMEPITVKHEMFASKYLHLKDVYQTNAGIVEKVTAELVKINESLQLINAHVGYRVRDEICFYMAYNDLGKLLNFDEAFDHCILQKILPRIAGTDTRVEKLLLQLYQLFTNKQYDTDNVEIKNAKYPNSTAKVVEMLRRLEDGFTSFWIS
ncbi:AAA family ATPase [Neobacillus sp. YIM B06451]|uniref:McrB family protein n=1 Tax=Neobacillus sp. YIM B06451 TaxID=3070994 RepID=UPI00292E4980|nr:AAA family ATPase [Neobacillus sp. YIM B06451]